MQSSTRMPVLEIAERAAEGPIRDPIRAVLWMATAAAAGAVMMALELAAFRLYAPYFGYSIYVWGSMIAVVMAALAAGYAVGGRLADSRSPELAVYGAILASAAWQLLVLYTAGAMLPGFAENGEFVGAGAATLAIFAPPMMALAACGPPLIRLCSRGNRVGSAAGRVYAASTVGSMAGILLTSFVLLPGSGTHATLKVWCAVSFVVAGLGLLARMRYPILAIFVAIAILGAPGLGWSDGTAWTRESAYNLIRVVRQGTRTLLILNHQTSVHTVRDDAGPWTGYYYDTFALGPLLVQADRALVLGMGAGASIRALRRAAPRIAIDAVEIDAEVVNAAAQWFGVDPVDPLLRIHIADARPWLRHDRGAYDLVQVDLYQGGPYVPFYLITEEFFGLVRAHMTHDGLLMMNLFDRGVSHELLFSTVATVRRVFPSVIVIPGANGNFTLLAFVQPHTAGSLRARVAGMQLERGLAELAREELAAAAEMSPPADTLVFTDDRAPVEELTRRMLAGRPTR
jgi:spermidine synthase